MFRIRTALFLLFIAFQSYGQQDSLDVYFNVTSAPTLGMPLEVEVRTNDFDDLIGVQLFVKWDSTVMNIVSVPFVNNMDLTGPTVLLPSQNVTNPELGQVKYNWFDAAAGTTLMDSTLLFTLQFNLVGQPCDETMLTIGDIGNFPSQRIEITNNDLTEVGARVTNAPVEIPGNNCDVVMLDPVGFNFPNISGFSGDNICMPLTVMNFDSIDSFGGSINFDSAVLDYTGVQGFGVSGFSATDFSLQNGAVTYAWADLTTANPETLADGSTLFEVCFDVIGNPGTSSTVEISGNPNQISVTKAGPTPSDPSTPLTFNVGSGGIAIPPVVAPNPVGFNFPSVTGNPGDNICIPLRVTDFNNIDAFSGSINYTSTVLEYTGVQNIGVPGMTTADFVAAGGDLSYSWALSPGASPVSIANGGVLFEICYDVIGAEGSSGTIIVSNAPTPINVSAAGANPGDPSIPLMFNVGSGMITVPTTGGPVVPEPAFFFPVITADTGDNICVPLTVNEFTDIISYGASFMWDSTVLQYTGSQGFNLPGLSSSLNENQVATGMLGLSWSDPTGVTPITLSSGATIMELCFDVIGSGGATSDLNMTNDPVETGVGYSPDITQPSINLDFTLNNGSVTINGGGGGPVLPEPAFFFPVITADNGDNVCVPLTVNQFTDIISYGASFMWDPAVLQYTGSQEFNLPGLNSSLNENQVATGMLGLSWSDPTGVTPITLANGATIMELCFDVTGNAGASSDLKMTNDPVQTGVGYSPDITQPSINLDFTLNNGSVTVNGGGGGNPNEVVFTFPNIQGNNGDNVCIPLTVTNFTSIGSVNGSVSWDPSILSFTQVGMVNVPGFTASNINANDASNGIATFVWTDLTTVTPATLANGETFFELCFDVIGDMDDVSPIRVVDAPTAISVSFQSPNPADPLVALDFSVVDGSYTVVNGGTTNPKDSISLIFPEVTVLPSTSSVCVPLQVTNFTNIAQLDFSLMWDPAVLTYTGVDNVLLPTFDMGQINPAGAANGTLTMSWFELTATQPYTAADSTAIMEFCFDVIGGDGTSTVVKLFDGLTPIVVGQAGASPIDPVMTVPYILDNGSITVRNEDIFPFKVNVESVTTGDPDDLACIDFTVEDFDNINLTEWTMQWDASKLCYNEVRNLNANVVGLDASDFGTFGNNRIKLSWSDPNDVGRSIPDGETYFTLCFDVKMACEESATVNIIEDATQFITFVVTNASNPIDPIAYDYNTDGGTVTLNCIDEPEPLMFSGAASITSAGCNNTGSITQRFEGGTAPYTCSWTGPGLSPTPTNCTSPVTVNNLGAGSYTLRLNDATGAVITRDYPITASTSSPNVMATTSPATCTTGGSFTLSATGGTPPYTYIPAQTQSNLAVGSYRVEVRDVNGCSDVEFITITDSCIPEDLEVLVTTTNGNCGIGGTIRVTPSGGTPAYQIFYSPAVINPNNIPPGTYTVRVRDAAGAEVSQTVVVGETPPLPLQILTDNIQPALCSGQGGSIDIDFTGGCEPITCELREVIGGMLTGAIPCSRADNLLPGTYEITAIPAFGDPVTLRFVIPSESVTSISPDVQAQDAGPCFGDNGVININASGGCPPYSAVINGTAVGFGIALSYPAGTYEVIIEDSFGQSVTSFVEVGGPTEALATSVIEVDCMGSLNISGGAEPYSILWTDSLGDTITSNANSLDITLVQDTTDVTASFGYTITDNFGCMVTGTLAVFCPGGDVEPCSDTNRDPITWTGLQGGIASCPGNIGCDGSIFGVLEQGECDSSPYSIVATNSVGESFSIVLEEPGAFEFSGLCAEVYSLQAEDADGNTHFPALNLAVITSDPIIITLDTIYPTMLDASGIDLAVGGLDISVTGGTPGYNVIWEDALANPVSGVFELTDLEAGTYFVSITDLNGCSVSNVYTVETRDTVTSTPIGEGNPIMTPNGDNLNDILFIEGAPSNLPTTIGIYDRWGRLVHDATNYNNDWDGTDLDGQPLREGAYYWVLTEDNGDTKTIHKGTVTILRNRN